MVNPTPGIESPAAGSVALKPGAKPKQSFDPRGKRSFMIFAIVACLVFVGGFALQFRNYAKMKQQTLGDGQHIESYGYDLSNLAVDRELIVASGLPKDGRLVLDHPDTWTVKKIDELNEARKGAWTRTMAGQEMVIGVAVNGEARAYPIRFMNWHEIVNDTLGGEPIAVTFSPISRAVAAFSREFEGRQITLGYSGLLFNQNLLMYDRAEKISDQSLWSQLGNRAIAGPALGKQLTALPCRVVKWHQWRKLHPNTTVMHGIGSQKRLYRMSPYMKDFKAGLPICPVNPLPGGDDASGLKLQSMIAAWFDEPTGKWRVMPEPFAEGTQLPDDVPVFYARWFAWYAQYGSQSAVLKNPAAIQAAQSGSPAPTPATAPR